eukprot:gene2540-2910_t
MSIARFNGMSRQRQNEWLKLRIKYLRKRIEHSSSGGDPGLYRSLKMSLKACNFLTGANMNDFTPSDVTHFNSLSFGSVVDKATQYIPEAGDVSPNNNAQDRWANKKRNKKNDMELEESDYYKQQQQPVNRSSSFEKPHQDSREQKEFQQLLREAAQKREARLLAANGLEEEKIAQQRQEQHQKYVERKQGKSSINSIVRP